MSANKKAREAKRIFMNAKTEQDQKRAAVEAAMGKMVELRERLMGFDVSRAEKRLEIATAECVIAEITEEQAHKFLDKGRSPDQSGLDICAQRTVIAKALQVIASLDLEAAKLLAEHEKISMMLKGG